LNKTVDRVLASSEGAINRFVIDNSRYLFSASTQTMTELLEQAIARVKTLSVNEQDAIASIILEELEDEQRWDEAFVGSADVLAKLAATAMAEYNAGTTQALDPETL
jgi:hypothetical protein